MDVGKLLALIQERPQLWDTRCDQYHDKMLKERGWDEVTQEMLAREWEKGNSAKRRKLGKPFIFKCIANICFSILSFLCAVIIAYVYNPIERLLCHISTVQRVKTRWQSCRDQYRRERVQGLGHSGEGGRRKKPYIYTRQLNFLRPVLDVRTTVDSLEPQRETGNTSSESDQAAYGQDSPRPGEQEVEPVQQLPDEEREESSALEGPSRALESSPQPRRRQPRRRRVAPPNPDSAANTQAQVQTQVLEYLRQRHLEGSEERMLSGLAHLFKELPAYKQTLFVDVMTSVFTIFKTPLDPHEVVCCVDNLKNQVFRLCPQPGHSMVPQHARPSSASQPLFSQEQPFMPQQSLPGPVTYPPQSHVAAPHHQGQGSFTQELFNL
ncbi:uncharacterized protein LOC120999324 [Bufo bufo]|uniref:uncharacterized protein LOC120999324 n=1 Tax=Bufo bufo TaxID=8384 RepID=UPI001ABDC8AD|nr:uncharacterized protein LOC120999324 [Bufo bufo]